MQFTDVNYRVLLLLIWLIVGLLLTSCNRELVCWRGTGRDCQLDHLALPGARLEIIGTAQPLHRSETLWLARQTDPNRQIKIAPKWDAYVWIKAYEDESCVDEMGNYLSMNEGCQRCDLCFTEGEFCDQGPDWGFAIGSELSLLSPTVIAYDEFLYTSEPRIVLEPHYRSGCSITSEAFVPEQTASYLFLKPPMFFPDLDPSIEERAESPLDQLKVFIVEPNMTQTVPYRMEYYATEPAPSPSPSPSATPLADTVFYKWTVRGEEVWEDNFTDEIRVTRVRVLTGTPGSDPVTGRFRLDNESVVRPSRIIFLKNYVGAFPPGDIFTHGDENTQRCYADENTADGNISMLSCRNSATGTTQFIVTPIHQSLFIEDMQRLTWFAEFKQSEGADFNPATVGFDPVPINAVLAIEFTIERIP